MAIKVEFAALQGASGDIQGTVGNLEQTLSDLKSFLAPMVSEWTGSASEAYQAKQAQWDTAFTDLKQVLGQIGSAVDTAAQNYQSAEHANQNVWA